MAEARGEFLAPHLESRRSPSVAVLWLALGVACSPVLFDLCAHWLEHPWARYSIPFVPLAFWVASVRPGRSEPGGARDGLLWIIAGVALTLFSVGGGMSRYGRVGVLIALLGMLRLTGGPGPRVWLLMALVIPLPDALVRRASPELETFLVELAQRVAGWLGAAIEVQANRYGASALAQGHLLRLQPADGGLPLLVLLCGLGYAYGLLRGAPARVALLRGAGWAALALPGQLVLLLASLFVLSAGFPMLGEGLLTQGGWMIAWALGLGLCWRGARLAPAG